MNSSEAVWFGAMTALSSTMVVVKMLDERGVTRTLASRVMVGLLVMQDLAVIPMLVLLPQAGAGGALSVLRPLAASLVLLALVVVLGTRLLPWLLRRILRWGSREMFLVAVVAISVGMGFGAHFAGLSFALGAFIAGLILSESEFSHQALSELAPLRDIFGLMFFVSVGMLFDPRTVLDNPWKILGGIAFVSLSKSLFIGLLARWFGGCLTGSTW